MPYVFGDADVAARRLRILADVFAEPSRAFLRDAVNFSPRLAIDLGCGPGYSTQLLAAALACAQVVGLDNSQQFIERARKSETTQVAFRRHDVTMVPFPVGPSDVVYCRFLLTHVKEPTTVVAQWSTQLRPNGLLLIEETECIRTENPVFRTYLGIVERMLAHESNTLYVGPVLDGLGDTAALRKRMNRIRWFPVATADAAAMFFLNLQSWKSRPFVRAHYTSATIAELAEGLHVLSNGPCSTMEIEWGLRQIAFERGAAQL